MGRTEMGRRSTPMNADKAIGGQVNKFLDVNLAGAIADAADIDS
jgi:hypothetical protein